MHEHVGIRCTLGSPDPIAFIRSHQILAEPTDTEKEDAVAEQKSPRLCTRFFGCSMVMLVTTLAVFGCYFSFYHDQWAKGTVQQGGGGASFVTLGLELQSTDAAYDKSRAEILRKHDEDNDNSVKANVGGTGSNISEADLNKQQLRLLGNVAGKHVADLGAGVGLTAISLQRAGATVSAWESRAKAANLAVGHGFDTKTGTMHQKTVGTDGWMDGEEEGSFDLMHGGYLMDGAAANEAAKLLKKGGRAVFNIGDDDHTGELKVGTKNEDGTVEWEGTGTHVRYQGDNARLATFRTSDVQEGRATIKPSDIKKTKRILVQSDAAGQSVAAGQSDALRGRSI